MGLSGTVCRVFPGFDHNTVQFRNGLGYLGKWEWIEKWLRITREKLEKQQKVILKWSSLVALLCWLPFVGDIFAVGLGFYKVPFLKTAILIFIGKALRFLFLIGLWFLT